MVAIVPAAGQGRRMNQKMNKQYLMLGDKPILAHTLGALEASPLIKKIIVVVGEEEVSFCREEVVKKYGFQKVTSVIKGGRERQDSVYQGLVVVPADADFVLIHDGARPLVTTELIELTVRAAKKGAGAICAVPMKDTVKAVRADGTVLRTIPRDELWAVQTPQVFCYPTLLAAHEKAQADVFSGTDDASLLEWSKKTVAVVPGSYENLKITTPIDLCLAQAILAGRR